MILIQYLVFMLSLPFSDQSSGNISDILIFLTSRTYLYKKRHHQL